MILFDLIHCGGLCLSVRLKLIVRWWRIARGCVLCLTPPGEVIGIIIVIIIASLELATLEAFSIALLCSRDES